MTEWVNGKGQIIICFVAGLILFMMPASGALNAQAGPAGGAGDAAVLELGDLEFAVKRGFRSEDAKGFDPAAPDVKAKVRLPIFPNRLFQAESGNRLLEYTIMTRFSASPELRSLKHPALKIKSIGENWAIYLNGELLRREVHLDGKGRMARRSYVRNLILPFRATLLKPENVLVFRVLGQAPVASKPADNYLLGLVAVRDNRIASLRDILEENNQSVQLILYGVYVFFGLYHLLIYFRRRRSVYNLHFGLFSILLAGYFLSFSNRAFEVIPDFTWQLYIGYTVQPLAMLFFLLFLISYFYPDRALTLLEKILLGGVLLIVAAFVFLPVRFFQAILLSYYPVALANLLYVIYFIARVIFEKLPDARKMAVGLSSGIVFVIWDILDTIIFNTQIRLLQYGHLFIVLSLVIILANRFLDVHNKSEELNRELASERNAFSRFVPAEFLEHLNHESIQDVRLGDHTLREMTILVSDIRNFTSLSEQLSPEENFRFLNEYLGRIGPVIREHGGFIDKYIGDAVMALFPGSADQAIRAVLEIRRELDELNAERARVDGRKPLDIGIGIHTGTLSLGTIGEAERMETTVISDAVNQAFRLESFTKTMGATAILSTGTLHNLADAGGGYEVRFLGKVAVKGRADRVSIYELLDALPAEKRERRLETRNEFEAALFHYYNMQFDEAAEILRELRRKDPEDLAVRTFLSGSDTQLDPRRAG